MPSLARRALAALAATSLAVGGLLIVAAPAQAAPTLPLVDTLSNNPVDGYTLFEAIADATANAGPDEIGFTAGLTGTIVFPAGQVIPESLQIVGPGSGQIVFTAAAAFDFFTFSPSSANQYFAIRGLSFDGNDSTVGAAIVTDDGLGFDGQYLTIVDVVITDLALDDRSAIDVDGLTGELFISDTVIQSNTGTVAVSGAGLNVEDVPEVTLEGTFFSENVVPGLGGGFAVSSVDAFRLRDSGGSSNSAFDGGLGSVTDTGFLLLDGVQVGQNEAGGSGGGLYLGTLAEIEVGDSSFFDNDAGGPGGSISFSAPVDMIIVEDSTFGDSDASEGGAIDFGDQTGEIRIFGSQFRGNTSAGFGGAVHTGTLTGGPVTVRQSTFSANSADDGGAGIYFDTIQAEIEIDSSTFSGNDAANAAGVLFGLVEDEVDVVDSTFDEGTSSGTWAIAVGLATVDGIVVVRHSTVVGPGGIQAGLGGGVTSVAHSIVQSTTADPSLESSAAGTIGVSWSVLSDDPAAEITAGAGVQVSTDAKLGALQNNGGPTFTRLPAASSPAVNAGDPAFNDAPSLDQRGLARVVGGRIDIGAVERGAELAPTGSEPSWLAGAGALLALLAGFGLTLTARRRRVGAPAL